MSVDWNLTLGKRNEMIMRKKIFSVSTFTVLLLFATSCYENETVNKPVIEVPYSDDEIDQFIQSNWIDNFGVAVRYKYVDRYVDPTKRVTPPDREVVMPMLQFLNDFWYVPFEDAANGDQFFREHVPAEVVLIGSSIFNEDGTVTLGTADAGARITLTEVNDIDLENKAWVLRQLGTIYHEFAHIVHQKYNLPPGWKDISPEGLTGPGSWYTLSDTEALERGFVSPYGTSSFNEDFAELVAFYLFHETFTETFIEMETCTDAACEKRNEGRAKLAQKLAAVLAHYEQYTGVDLTEVRENIQAILPE
jgi:substrate import-associated zinc metallohydrolase lipoprotein